LSSTSTTDTTPQFESFDESYDAAVELFLGEETPIDVVFGLLLGKQISRCILTDSDADCVTCEGQTGSMDCSLCHGKGVVRLSS